MSCCLLAWRFSSKFYSRGAGIGIAVAVAATVAIMIILLGYSIDRASCKACFCIHRLCALPGDVLCSMLLCLLYTIKCGMSLTVSVQNSFESGKSVIVRLTHPINAY